LDYLDRQGSIVVARVITAELHLTNELMTDGQHWSDGIGGKLEIVRTLRGSTLGGAKYFASTRAGDCSLWEPLRVNSYYLLGASRSGEIYQVDQCSHPLYLAGGLSRDPEGIALLRDLERHFRDGSAFDEERLFGLVWPAIPDPAKCTDANKTGL